MTSTGSPLRSDVVSLEPQGIKGVACRVCSRRSFPERPLCPHCGADAVDNVMMPAEVESSVGPSCTKPRPRCRRRTPW